MYICMFWMFCFFFFKQKTAYEMRISDWSSDVCSSDLVQHDHIDFIDVVGGGVKFTGSPRCDALLIGREQSHVDVRPLQCCGDLIAQEIGRASCRERVCQYV